MVSLRRETVVAADRKDSRYLTLYRVTTKVIRDQPELFEGGFEVVDDFLGDEDSNKK